MSGKTRAENDDLADDDIEWDADSEDSADFSDNDNTVGKTMVSGAPRARDWRDLERWKEERELQKLLDNNWHDDL